MAHDQKDVTFVTDCLVFFDCYLRPKGDLASPSFRKRASKRKP